MEVVVFLSRYPLIIPILFLLDLLFESSVTTALLAFVAAAIVVSLVISSMVITVILSAVIGVTIGVCYHYRKKRVNPDLLIG